MNSLFKGLLVATVVAGTGVLAAPKASADMIITNTAPNMVDFSTFGNPVVLSQPAVINTMPVDETLVQPSVIETAPIVAPAPIMAPAPVYYGPRHLLNFGLGNLLRLNLF